jgi:hypothetical protein
MHGAKRCARAQEAQQDATTGVTYLTIEPESSKAGPSVASYCTCGRIYATIEHAAATPLNKS